MYKLVVVAGKLRGNEYILEPGENTVGRSDECSVHLDVDGVSKKHLSVTVTDDVAYLKDLGSSNGTFVNDVIVKKATVKNGDKIALPDLILQVVYVKEKKIYIRKETGSVENEEEKFLKGGTAPDNPIAKLIHYFKYRFMQLFYGINEEYEWKILIAIMLTVFVIINITTTILPVLRDNQKILVRETAKRGAHYAEEISRINAKALEKKKIDQVDTNFLNDEDGVKSYELFDLEGRIVRPIGKLNEYTEDTFSVQTLEWAKSTRDKGDLVIRKILDDGEIGIGRKIMAFNSRLNLYEPVGVIAIRFAPKSLSVESSQNSRAYFEALMTAFMVCVVFYGVLYFLTLRPVEELNFSLDEALRGKLKEVEGKYLMVELKGLKNNINSLLSRVRELQRDEVDQFEELESDEEYVRTVKEFLRGAGGPALCLDSEKNLAAINLEAEDLTGIRESAGEGMSLLDVSREKGFAATLIDLCDQSASEGGSCKEGHYEIQGREYKIFANSLIGKDGFAKSFYLTFNEDDDV